MKLYSYAPVGEKSVKHYSKVAKNITCCATISDKKVELLRFFYGGGTKNEVFEEYFEELTATLLRNYPDKKILIVMDNYRPHKSCFILKIMQYYP